MTTSTTQAHRKVSHLGNHRLVMIKMTIISGDNIETVKTGVTAKALDHTTVAGGVLTVNFTDPVATCALYVTAIGI
jgi:hypothetical protein